MNHWIVNINHVYLNSTCYWTVRPMLTHLPLPELNPGPPMQTYMDKSIHLIGDSMITDMDELFKPAFNNRVKAHPLRGADVGWVTRHVRDLAVHTCKPTFASKLQTTFSHFYSPGCTSHKRLLTCTPQERGYCDVNGRNEQSFSKD